MFEPSLDASLQSRFDMVDIVHKDDVVLRFRVRYRNTGQLAVLEQVHRGLPCSDEDLAPARALIGVDARVVAEVYEVGRTAAGLPYVVREDPAGVTLKEAITSGHLSPPVVVDIARQCLSALARLHARGLWCQNLAPADIVLTYLAGRLRAVIVDAGVLGRWREAPAVTAGSSLLVGRLKYAAPEQFDDASELGPTAGIYALGLVMYEALTGRFPIRGSGASSLIAGHLFRPPIPFDESDPQGLISPELRGVVATMLSKAPSDRFESAAEASAFLDPLAQGLGPVSVRALGDWITATVTTGSTPQAAPASVQLPPVPPVPSPAPSPAAGPSAAGPTALIQQVRAEVDEASRVDLELATAKEEAARRRADELVQSAQAAAQAEDFAAAAESVDDALSLIPGHPGALALKTSLGALLRIQEEEREERLAGGAEVDAHEAETVRFSADDLAAVRAQDGATTRRAPITEGVASPVGFGATGPLPIQPPDTATGGGEPRADESAVSADRTLTAESSGVGDGAAPPLPPTPPSRAAAPSSVRPTVGSVTLPMATVEAARRRAAEIARQSSGVDSSGVDSTRTQESRPAHQGSMSDGPGPGSAAIAAPGPGRAVVETPSPDPFQADATEPPFAAVEPGPPSPSPAPQSSGTQDRKLSDFGFGAPEPSAPSSPGLYSPDDAPVAAPPRRGGLQWGWILAFLVVLAGVFAASFYLSGFLTDTPALPPEATVEDVSGTELPPGFIALDASPWAEIVSVSDAGGETELVAGAPFTPKRWAMAPGLYTVTLTHPSSESPQVVEISVESGQVTRRHVEMEVDVSSVLKEGRW